MDHYFFPKGGIVIWKKLSAWDHLCYARFGEFKKNCLHSRSGGKNLQVLNRWWKKISYLLEIMIAPRGNNGLSLSRWDLSTWKISKQMLSFFSKMSRTILSVSSPSCSLTPVIMRQFLFEYCSASSIFSWYSVLSSLICWSSTDFSSCQLSKLSE